jgi:solute:Na+ symporter, SSS family
MTGLDWVVLVGTLTFIVTYGAFRAGRRATSETYLRGGNEDRWHTIGLSVMATQASAITFLSTPGQAYEEGMGFVQLYFGLPLAMVILAAIVVPKYYQLRVFTAYEFLESRFDLKTRQLTALLFLVQRGLSAGITIYAPAIILSNVLGWPLDLTNVVVGGLVITYTVVGGTRAVSRTQKHQMAVMMAGMAVAFVWVLSRLPAAVSFSDSLSIAGAMGRMNAVDFSFNPRSRYNFWSGIAGGLFLAMSYFGTDQSQVQRYLSGRSIRESRLGLLFNGLFKIPMQFLILLTGVMVLVLHQFEQPPVFFNRAEWARVGATSHASEARRLEEAHRQAFARKREAALALESALATDDPVQQAAARTAFKRSADESGLIRQQARALVKRAVPGAESKDADYIFIGFVMEWLPQGLVGLLLAVILCAAMSSSAGELAALGTTSVVDFYRRSVRKHASDRHYLLVARISTAIWGVAAVSFATFASLVDNLIQAVNIVGSLFYGTILGVFLVAFFTRRIGGTAVFVSALLSEAAVIACSALTEVGFLWWNVIGCGLVFVFAWIIQPLARRASQ